MTGLGGLSTECEDARRESPEALDRVSTASPRAWRAQTVLHRVRLTLPVLVPIARPTSMGLNRRWLAIP